MYIKITNAIKICFLLMANNPSSSKSQIKWVSNDRRQMFPVCFESNWVSFTDWHVRPPKTIAATTQTPVGSFNYNVNNNYLYYNYNFYCYCYDYYNCCSCCCCCFSLERGNASGPRGFSLTTQLIYWIKPLFGEAVIGRRGEGRTRGRGLATGGVEVFSTWEQMHFDGSTRVESTWETATPQHSLTHSHTRTHTHSLALTHSSCSTESFALT